VSGQVPPEVVEALLAACKGPSFGELQGQLTDIIADGYSAHQLLLQLSQSVRPAAAAVHPARQHMSAASG
jgi:hypothetical protein